MLSNVPHPVPVIGLSKAISAEDFHSKTLADVLLSCFKEKDRCDTSLLSGIALKKYAISAIIGTIAVIFLDCVI